ncbi:MAG: hypothetical protein ABL989_07310 [Gammaproteobacteria bacterium]
MKRFAFLVVLALVAAPIVALLLAVVPALFGISRDPEPVEILNGYYFVDSGGFSELEFIGFQGGKDGFYTIIIDSRVDRYRLEGSNILVAQRPFVLIWDANGRRSPRYGACQYWVIDTVAQTVVKTENDPIWPGIECYGVFQRNP